MTQGRSHFGSIVIPSMDMRSVNGTFVTLDDYLTITESGRPVFRGTSPLSRGQFKSKGDGKVSIHHCADLETMKSHNYFCVSALFYEAVAEICEEYGFLRDKTGKPVVGGQSSSSFVPSVIKTNAPLDTDDRAERIEKVSQQNRLSTFCMDAGFLNDVEIGQYYMTKDTEEFSQSTNKVACCEYTLLRDEETSELKG